MKYNKIHISKYELVEVETIWGDVKKCIVCNDSIIIFTDENNNINLRKKNSLKVKLSNILNDDGVRIAYPIEYIRKLTVLDKKEALFYINSKNFMMGELLEVMHKESQDA